jgi:hypothetical protein
LARLSKKEIASYLRETPRQMDRALRAYSRDAKVLSSNRPRLMDTHPKQWVAIRDGRLAATGKSFAALVSRLKAKGLSPGETMIRYVDKGRRKLIL